MNPPIGICDCGQPGVKLKHKEPVCARCDAAEGLRYFVPKLTPEQRRLRKNSRNAAFKARLKASKQA